MNRETENYIENEVQLRILNYKISDNYKDQRQLFRSMNIKCNIIILILVINLICSIVYPSSFGWF